MKQLLTILSGAIALAPIYSNDLPREITGRELRELKKKAKKPSVKRAFRLKETLARRNQEDIERLLQSLRSALKQEKEPLADDELVRISLLIDADIEALKALQNLTAAAKFDKVKYITFTKSIAHFLGDATSPGLFAEAKKLIKERPSALRSGRLDKWRPRNHEITVLKVALLYAVKHLARHSRIPLTQVKMLYPAELPPELGLEPEDQFTDWLRRRDNGTYVFMVPNAGYVYGGNFDTRRSCVGTDCSAFTSFVTRSETRLSTWVMEFTYREHMKEKFEEDELPIRAEFLEKWGMAAALKEYEPVNIEKGEKPREGDVIIWRFKPPGKDSFTRHSVVYLAKARERANFYSIEASRTNDNTLEGVFVREMPLRKDNGRIFALRRRSR